MKLKKISQKQEKDVAKELGGRTVVASGAFWGAKGDVRSDEFLVECKTTQNAWYVIHAKTWEKIEQEAIRDRLKRPVLVIDLNNGAKRIAVFSPHDFYKDIKDVPYEYIDMRCNVQKTFRINTRMFTYNSNGVIFSIHGQRKNILHAISFNYFKEVIANGIEQYI